MGRIYDLKLDANHDLSVKDGDLEICTGMEAIAQDVKISLLTWLGEYVFNSEVGMPYEEIILVKNPRRNVINSVIREKILAIEGVISVKNISFTIDNKKRAMNINALINTKYGVIKI